MSKKRPINAKVSEADHQKANRLTKEAASRGVKADVKAQDVANARRDQKPTGQRRGGSGHHRNRT